MPPAARIAESTNHPGVIAGPGVSSVIINGLPAVAVGDTHICAMPPKAGPHPPNPIATGSKTVLIGGRPAARKGDMTGCGAAIIAGSSNVLIGG